MKKLIVLFVATLLTSQSYAQDSKGYVGLNLGVGLPIGDTGDAIDAGFELGLINLGFRFTETFGATLNWGASGHISTYDPGITVGVGYLSLGPMISAGRFDFKPQYAVVSTVIEVDGYKLTIDCKGVVLGATYDIPLGSNWALAANADYFNFKPTKDEQEAFGIGDEADNLIKLSLGVRYLF